MAGGNIGDDRVWLYSDTYHEYVSDYPECDPKSEAYISVHAIEMVLNMLEGAACVERRGSAYFIRDKLGLLPDATHTQQRRNEIMTPEQAAAFVQSQTACAMAEMASMHAENREREMQGHTHAHGAESFSQIPNEFLIGYNDVVGMFRDANEA